MGLETGKKLGPYEIVSPLGAGGMGEVYRARDTRLERDVAVKVLPAHLANDLQLKQRFEREARTVSSLNHPHICTLYDIGREGSTDFLVMEYLEGETLSKRLERGPLAPELLLQTAVEISDALDKAHRKGVIHRDLKPGNIMLTPHGGAKVLDFGLAKAAGPLASGSSTPAAAPTANMSASPTMSSPLTTAGSIVGTFQYMSPEQLEGREADARSDIFSLGAVLYEMATAKKAFPGKSQYSVASAILEKNPEPISTITPQAPRALERVINRALAKDPEDRWQSARDVTIELEGISAGDVGTGTAPAQPETEGGRAQGSPLQRFLPWGVAAIGLVAAAALAVFYFGRPPMNVHVLRSFITPPEKTMFAFESTYGGPVLSPDGTRMVFPAQDDSGKEALWVRPMDSLSAQRLDGTEGAIFPFWAPDSRHVAFFQSGKLRKIDVTGGPAVSLCDVAAGRGGAWNRDDVIIFSPTAQAGKLQSVPAAGGTPTPITTHQGSGSAFSSRWPEFLPDGKHYLYLSGDLTATGTNRLGIYLGELGSKEDKFLVQADSDAVYASPGYLLFLRGATLMAQPFDAGSQELKGEAFPIAEQVGSPQLFRRGLFTVSQTGLLVYQTGGGASSGQFIWYDSSGKELGKVGQPGPQDEPVLSPDGKRLAYVLPDPEGKIQDIWIMDLARNVRTRFTFGPSISDTPVWSPDGSRIVFESVQKGHGNLYVKNASGAGSPELLYESNADKVPLDWSRDGRYILFVALDPEGKTKYDLWALPMFGDHKPISVAHTQFDEVSGAFSPDGHWVAYESDESGTFDVYLSPFPAGGAKWQVSQGGGVQPVWKPDGSALYYLAPGGKLMQASIEEKGSAVMIGSPQELFEQQMVHPGAYGRSYSVAPDGKRFLVIKSNQGAAPPLTLVANWTAGLKK